MKILLILLIILFLVTNLVSLFLVCFSLKRHFKYHMVFGGDDETQEVFYRNYWGDEKQKVEFNSLMEEVEIESDGLKLRGKYLRNSGHKVMVFFHGYMCKYKEMRVNALDYYHKGYSCLMVDARGHGESDGEWRGMGYLDRLDNLKWIDWIISNDLKAEIVLYGRSMGGAAVLYLLGEKLPDNVKCAIDDCGYGSLFKQFKGVLKDMFKLPAFPILYLSSMWTKLICGYSILEADVYPKIKDNKIPLMFIHGEKDGFVSNVFSKELYQLATCKKKLYIAKDAEHSMSYVVDKKGYYQEIDEFLEENLSNSKD